MPIRSGSFGERLTETKAVTMLFETFYNRLRSNGYLPSETDSSYSRSISFLESSPKVQKVLGRLGLNAPLHPDYSDLADPSISVAFLFCDERVWRRLDMPVSNKTLR